MRRLGRGWQESLIGAYEKPPGYVGGYLFLYINQLNKSHFIKILSFSEADIAATPPLPWMQDTALRSDSVVSKSCSESGPSGYQ